MSTKFMKVYVCDYCGKVAPREIHYCGLGDVIRTTPDGWMRKCKMDLCPTCGSNFANFMEGKKEDAED